MNLASQNVTSANAEQSNSVAVIMGSDSDLPSLQPAIKILEDFGIQVETRILSAHRTPHKMIQFADEAESKGLKVIIAGAGGAAHLPGMVASLTNIPVIGVPISTKTLKGIDSLYSIVQMPGGIPVATVAINGGLNAGLLAAQILGTAIPSIRSEVSQYRKKLRNEVKTKDQKLIDIGISQYIADM